MPSEPVLSGQHDLDTTVVRAVRVRRAADVSDVVGARRYLHAGPPLPDGAPLTGTTRGSLIGALLFEQEASSPENAAQLIDGGGVSLVPCHDAGAVGAVAGIVPPSMPVVVVEDDAGVQSFSPLNEGLGRVLRFGAYDGETIGRLRWMRDVAAPILDDSLCALGGVNVTALQAEGLRRGDECHNRNVASTAVLALRLAPAMVNSGHPPAAIADVLSFIAGNPHFFLSFSIAAAKRVLDRAQMSAAPGLVTAISFNGFDFGIRVSGFDDRWFTAPVPSAQEARFFDGFSIADANPAVGDSGVMEALGIGCFAITAAPALFEYIGGDPASATRIVEEMRTICRGESTRFLIPAEGFRGSPVGIDVAAVAGTRSGPFCNMGIAHREPGRGQIGAGLIQLPVEPFAEAAEALARAAQPIGPSIPRHPFHGITPQPQEA